MTNLKTVTTTDKKVAAAAKRAANKAAKLALAARIEANPCIGVIGVEAVDRTGDYVSASMAKKDAETPLLDTYGAIGIKSLHCVSPKGDAQTALHMINGAEVSGKQLHLTLKETIVLGFSQDKRDILNTPTKGMSDVQKGVKKKIQQSIGAVLKDIKNALNKREEADNNGAGSTTRELDVRVTAFLNDAKKAIQNADEKGLTFDATGTIKGIDAALEAVAKKL
jgi:hypothetical protein